MVVNNILILGSTLLTELTIKRIRPYYNLVGYVPSENPTIKGKINLPVVDIDAECDIKLSIQYDKMVKDTSNCYNVHTGLLPEYGGTNILSYTIKNKEREQGLTFHKMSDDFDYGPIISKVTYPVYEDDTMVDLYDRITKCFPSFVLSGLKLLESLDEHQVNNSYKEKPRVFKRGNIDDMDSKLYEDTLKKLKRKYEKI